MSKEKRVFSRIVVPTRTTLLHKKRAYPVRLKNISLQGATLETNGTIGLTKGNACMVSISPEEMDATLNLEAMTMYCENGTIGVQFSENNPQTVKQLRLIISSNFDNKQ